VIVRTVQTGTLQYTAVVLRTVQTGTLQYTAVVLRTVQTGTLQYTAIVLRSREHCLLNSSPKLKCYIVHYCRQWSLRSSDSEDVKWLTVNKLQDKQQNCVRVTMRVSRDIGQQVPSRALAYVPVCAKHLTLLLQYI